MSSEHQFSDSSTLDPALLTASLAQPTLAKPLYSARAGFYTAFAGGVYAAALFGLVNCARVRRLRQEAWICVLAAVAWTFVLFWAAQQVAPGTEAPEWMMLTGNAGRTTRNLGKALGMLLVGALYLRHKQLYKAQELSGVPSPNAWPLGLGSLAVSIVLSFAVVMLGLAL